jgi:hypothetical protein
MPNRSRWTSRTLRGGGIAVALAAALSLATPLSGQAQTPKQDKAAVARGVAQPAQGVSGVRINRVELDLATVQALGQYGIQVAAGD